MLSTWHLAKSFPSGRRGMVATKHPVAAEVGAQVLRQGGSAVDAAVATSLALSVVEPYASGIGGGGLALYAPAGGATQALHFGMRAPASARPDMYRIVSQDRDDQLFGWCRTEGNENIWGPRSVCLPGQVAGLFRLWEIGGRLPWRDLVEPAWDLAASGVPVEWLVSLYILRGQELLSRFPASREVFLPHGKPPEPDLTVGADILRQPDKARSLEAIARDPQAMYRGAIAQAIIEAVEGRFTLDDFAGYRPLEGEAITISFRGLEVEVVPWATGGPTAVEWLGILQHLDFAADENDPEFWWAIASAGEVAMRDRLERLADPELEPFPTESLDPAYHRRMAEQIRREQPAAAAVPRDGSTSHLAVIDDAGNAVNITQTLLSLWGSGMVAPGTGIVLNNGMMWFDPQPGYPNSVGPGKLPLANMCPVMVRKDGKPFLIYGASGGRKIMGAVVQILVRVSMLGQSLAEAIAAPRLDISGPEILADERFDLSFRRELARRLERPVTLRTRKLGAPYWASPVGLMRNEDGSWTGGADLYGLGCVVEA